MSKIDSHRCALQEEQAEKVRLVEVYNARLTGRERRRAFIRDRGLLNVKRMQVGASPFCGFPLCRAVVRTPGGTDCDTGSGRGRQSTVLAKRRQSGLGHIGGCSFFGHNIYATILHRVHIRIPRCFHSAKIALLVASKLNSPGTLCMYCSQGCLEILSS